MKRVAKGLVLIISLVIIVVVGAIFIFNQSLKPDEDKEEKVKVEAKKYLKTHFTDSTVIYDTLYDNMGNFPFEYAAKVTNEKDQTNFLVYYNDEVNEMEDSYISSKWESQLNKKVRPYIIQKFEPLDELIVFYDAQVGKTYNINPNIATSYKDYNASPSITISIARKPKKEDAETFSEMVSFLKKEAELKHGTVTLNYVKKGVPQSGKEIRKEF
ncbi:hypothetical protein COJ70_10130 [Priestia megaterium]|uniref:Uncharacterized protein n=3 Tax=Bacillaceae TaxID=186817 RepID=A0AAE5P353_PRIMG|nr:hypothetical protein [Priestia megaterium]RFB26600.1 hypothetical protein DZB87_18345 [Bacillus sp. ALD]ANF48983.1 hypothetical protein AZK53_17840 [Priestia megaterium]AQU76676.1 hypothetical protein BUW91_18640 [Priestia megaterium]MBM6598716.1 hypothetical protein [Priestia megaterium]MBW0930225.1 hypothetical protein [Priestia megaterium]